MHEERTQPCAICARRIPFDPRYPRRVCPRCADRACDGAQRPLVFFNVSLSGGFVAHYRDTGEVYESHLCFIDGIECWAGEARFGGIVVQRVE